MEVESAPGAVAVMVTAACTGWGGAGPDPPPHPGRAKTRTRTTEANMRSLRPRDLRPTRSRPGSRRARLAGIGAGREPVAGRSWAEVADVDTVSVTAAGWVEALMDEGVNEHCAPVGNPEQAKVTFSAAAVD